MDFFKWLIGGVIGATSGIALWVGVVHFTGYEVGIVAWLVGVLVGVGIAVLTGPNRGVGAAVFAGCFAFLAIIGGKGAVAWTYSQQLLEEGGEFAAESVTEEFLISCIADEVVYEYEWQGERLNYPRGADLDFPDSEEDYPADVWAEAQNRWYMMSDSERGAYRAGVEFGAEAMPIFAFVLTFIMSFGLFDLIWIVLAVGSAYRIVKNVPSDAQIVANPGDPSQENVGFLPMAAPPPEDDPVQPAPPQEAAPAPAPAEPIAEPAAESVVFFPGAMPDAEPMGEDEDLRQAG